MSNYKKSSLLVTGAAGHLGRLAVEALLARGATNIIAGTRDPAKLADLAAKGVTIKTLDFDDPSSLATAFAGVERVLLVSTDAIGRRAAQHAAAIAAAKAAGVKHIVYTSAPAASPNPDNLLANEHFATEQALAASGIGYTILRNHIYAEGILQSAPSALASGQWFDATNGGGRNYIWRADAAAAAAGALLSADGAGIYDVTGPQPVTQTEVAALVGSQTGKPVTRVGLTGDQLRGGLLSHGVPEFIVNLIVNFDLDAAAGYHAITTDVVEKFSGRKPRSVAEFVAANSSALLA